MADINQWQLPRNEADKLLGWRSDGKGMENKDWVSPADLDGKQDHSVNLDELAAVDPGTAGKSILALQLASDVRDYLDVPTYVATRTELKALNTTKDTVAYLRESNRQGLFKWTTGDYSTQIAADAQEGVYVKADAIASSAGAWVRSYKDELDPLWFGAAGDGTTDDSTAITGAIALGVEINGFGRTYKVSSAPSDFTVIKNAAFKAGSITHISRDFLRTDTAKITDGLLYTAWTEDKCYLVGDQIRVWVNEKESHPDGTGRIVLYFSDDNGASFSHGEYLDLAASGRTLWCAGFSGSTEYLIVRVPSGSTDVPPYTYERWSRTITFGAGTGEFNGAWTVTAITFPTPSGFTGQPVMVISFTAGHSNSIVVGTSYGEGAAVARSTDGGATWTSFIIGTDTDLEEPTVKYDSSTQRYYGFCRNGGSGNPVYWHSGVDDLSSISRYTAPVGTFGASAMTDSPVPFQIRNGRVHAFSSYRNGTLEGAASDELTSAYYMDMPLHVGNIWTQSTTKIYRLGTIPHREGAAGSSACGVGSVVIVDDKVHLFYGMEERTGTTSGLNRIANIYQTVIFLADRNGMFDFRNDLVANRSAGPLRRMVGGKSGFLSYTSDASGDYPGILSGRPNFALRNSAVTIAGGVLTLSGLGRYGHYLVDTEAAAATDDLDTITDADAKMGDVIILSTSTSGRDVVVKNGTGNILCGGADKTLSTARDRIVLQFTNFGGTAAWSMLDFGDNS
ncbi:hypothetical protein GOA75_20045 [Sinorhizobium meliloti]|nr:hypothetical protein [Sinorhizobium meliloti]MDW9632134.1 hypothetical protein [Sinorhizobium meliloti]